MTNDERIQKIVDGIDKDELIGQLLRKIESLAAKKRYLYPLWSHVGEATMHGSGVSSGIVRRFYPECKS